MLSFHTFSKLFLITHRFPFHTTHLLNQWTAFTNRGALWQPSRWSSICSRHFRLSDYRDHLFRKCLKRTAVPSVRVQLPFAFVAATMDYESSTTFPSHGADSQISEAADIVVGEQRDPERSHQLLASCPSPAVASTPLPSSQYLQYCRLCANTDPGTRRLDETTIADILHKYVTLDPDDRLSQLVCSDCLLQLNRFVQFVDRIVSMQSELMQRLVNKAMPCSLPATQSTPDIYSQAPTETKAAANSMAIPLPPTSAPLFIASRQSQTPTVTATAANPPPKLIHIKQEPVQLLANVKQEFSDSNRNAAAQLPSKHAPTLECQPDVDAFCETCDVYFINNLELKTHIINCHKSTSNVIPFTKSHHLPDQDLSIQPNSNCEIMEIITLENTFINLAEEAEPVCDIDEAIAVTADDMIPLERVLKVEHFNDYEQRELQLAVIRREHNYNRRLETAELQPRILGDFKQEFKSNESAMEAAVVLQSLSSLMPANSALLADQVNKTGEHMQHANLPASRTMTLPSIYQCAICAFRCTSLSPLQRHIATTHRQFKCSQCVRTFRSRLLRLSHQQFAHRRIALPYRRTPITLLCTNCSHQFYAKAAWRNHRIVCDRWHSVVKPVLSTRGSQRSRALSRIRFMIMSRLMTSAGRLRGQTMQPMPRFECGTCKRAFGHYLSYVSRICCLICSSRIPLIYILFLF